MGFLPRVSASNHNEVRLKCVMFHYGSSQSSDSVSEGMSSSPSSVEQAEMVLSDSEMRSVVSWSTNVWEVSAMRVALVAVEMVERGSGERGRTVSEGERARMSKFLLSLTTSPFFIFSGPCLFSGLSQSSEARLEL